MKQTNPPVTHVQQEGDNQCWVACMKMMLDQKRVKADSPKVNGDVVLINYEAINSRVMHSKADSPLRGEFFETAFHSFGTAIETTSTPASWDTIKDNIDRETPMMMGVYWSQGGGHVMVISGYEESNGQRWVWLNDPATDSGAKVHYDRLARGNYEFPGREDGGEWSLTLRITGDAERP